MTHHDRQTIFRNRNFETLIFRFVVFCFMTLCFWKVVLAEGVLVWGFETPEMVVAKRNSKDVIGDLGGMPVKISRHVAEYVEYEGGPVRSVIPRKGQAPERTYASKLVGFGFYVRVPDMAMLTTKEMLADKANSNVYNTDWIRVEIATGERFPGNGFMNSRQVSNDRGHRNYGWTTYEELPDQKFGLLEYRLTGIHSISKRPIRERSDAEVIYIHRDPKGNVLTRIDCSNVDLQSAPCSQEWSLEDQAISARIRVLYRRGFLRDWAEIQNRVGQVIFNFRAEKKQKEAEELPKKSIHNEMETQ
jgi:hypothetical protein